MTDTAIYIHVPYCIRKCDYCDFYSLCDKSTAKDYTDAVCGLLREKGKGCRAAVKSVFFGGGTPSYIGADALCRMLDTVSKAFELDGGAEISAEINPKTVNRSELALLKSAGFNRISVGVQSFSDAELIRIGRLSHTVKDAENALYNAKSVGFSSLSLDLMYGLPSQSLAEFEKNISRALSFEPDHLSAYSLQLEENTPLYKRVKSEDVPDQDLCFEMYSSCTDMLEQAGLYNYEISNFAKKGHECRHNLRYWLGGDYIGIGPSASGFENGVRYTYPSDIGAFIEGCRPDIEPTDPEYEYIMLRTRLSSGLDKADYTKRFSKDADALAGKVFEKYVRYGYAVNTKECFRLTKSGRFISSTVINDLTEALL